MQIADIDFCTPADLDELYEIERACFDQPWQKNMMAYDLDNQGLSVYMKASFNGKIAGYSVISRSEGVCHLLNIAVLPDFQRMGVAKQLFLALQVIAEEWECMRVRLEVRSSNRLARDFYTDIGFGYHSRRKGYYSDGEDALVLVARLPLKIE